MSIINVVCKHNQTGFCKYSQHCQKDHVVDICPNIDLCKDPTCTLRHPKICKTYEAHGKCHFVDCAYRHVDNRTNLKIEHLENVVEELKFEIVKLGHNMKEDNIQKKQTMEILDRDIKALRYDINMLTKNIKSTELLVNKLNEKETVKTLDMKTQVTLEKMPDKEETMKKFKDTKHIKSQKQDFKCDQCDFLCPKNETLMKHTNTKHDCKTEIELSQSECSICDDRFKTKAEYQKHKQEHLEEIEGLDITTLTNGHDLFECNLCSFESGVGDSIKEHLVDHLNHTKEYLNEAANNEKKSLLDEYDDDGNFIGDESNLTDSDNESETEDYN